MIGSNPIRVYCQGRTLRVSNLPRKRATANFKDGQDRLLWSFGWTIAVVGEILTQPHESTWYWIVNQLFGEL